MAGEKKGKDSLEKYLSRRKRRVSSSREAFGELGIGQTPMGVDDCWGRGRRLGEGWTI